MQNHRHLPCRCIKVLINKRLHSIPLLMPMDLAAHIGEEVAPLVSDIVPGVLARRCSLELVERVGWVLGCVVPDLSPQLFPFWTRAGKTIVLLGLGQFENEFLDGVPGLQGGIDAFVAGELLVEACVFFEKGS